MKKYLWMLSAAVVIGAFRVKWNLVFVLMPKYLDRERDNFRLKSQQ